MWNEYGAVTPEWNKISSAFQWITKLSHSSSSQEWQRDSTSYLSRNIAFYVHIFLMENECFSFELMGPRHPPEMLGVQQRLWTRAFSADTWFASCHTVTYAGICTHQSWLVSHPSLDGRGRDPSDRLILNCFHSLGWHPVSEVIYTVARWKLVHNAVWAKMILLASWSEHPSINALRVTLLAPKSAPGRSLCYEASLACSHTFF